ncbi:AraC family transcriptional regulator [Ruminococcaceae bacterium OttesenSCG-928-A16]|nr:AraC family transcriptional regulator [Ruminococcaceae bacterium OttesenSCG-928-A16]
MTFETERYCAPAKVFEHTGTGFTTLGKKGMLGVCLISSGQCSLGGQPGQVLAGAGSFVVVNSPTTLTPLQNSHIIGVLLSGAAPAAAAESLPTPLVLAAGSCQGAPEILYQLLANKTTLPPTQASALAYTLLCQLANASANPAGQTIPPLIAAAITEIREHYAEVYGIEELAAGLGVTKSHLVRSFTAAVGTSPGRYLTAVRLDAAKRLLLHREYTLDTIASLCGFAGANYFCRVFKKETGQTPANWRAKTTPHTLPLPDDNEWEKQLFL